LLADKIHNLRSILESYASLGVQVWDAFTRGKDDTMWYYAAMLDVFQERLQHPLVDEYAKQRSTTLCRLYRG